MTEELGVLVLEFEKQLFKYNFLAFRHFSLVVDKSNYEDVVLKYSFKCTRKEAEQFPQFKWVSLEGLK